MEPSTPNDAPADPSRNVTGDVPQAHIIKRSPGVLAVLAASYMWVLAVLCLLVAVGLVWWSMPEQGVPVTIRFPEGHGLEAGDSVRFRGIEVGTVQQVRLNPSLSAVDVSVNLLPFAEPIAREGSRFWIVRPELSLGQVSGLETAVGHKYIGVLPGDPEGEWQISFDGMAKSPPDTSDDEGTEIILRGDQRHGVSPGSPLHFRGILVGRVISVDLSRDAKHVEMRVKLYQKFAKLVTSETRFWASSGVNLDLRWGSGLKVDVESLETIVKGGVSMLTIKPGGKPVQPGQLFEIAANPEDDWLEQASQTAVTELENLRAALKLRGTWKQSGMLYGTVDKDASFVGTHLQLDDNHWVAVPTDMIQAPEKAKPDTFSVHLAGQSENLVATLPSTGEQPITLIKVDAATMQRSTPFQKNEIRVPNDPESCLAVRLEGELSNPSFFHMPIDVESLDAQWLLKDFDGDREVWHGAPVIADSDNRLIGFLQVEDRTAKVIPVWDKALAPKK